MPERLIAGPVMVNGAADQISPFPFSYSDVETFQELAEWLMRIQGENSFEMYHPYLMKYFVVQHL